MAKTLNVCIVILLFMVHMLTAFGGFRASLLLHGRSQQGAGHDEQPAPAANGDRGGYSSGLVLTYDHKASVALNIYTVYSKFNIHPYS
jgi:hypothetical protein